MNRLAFIVAAHCLALPVAAQTVVSGDSIELKGKTYRLYGIDAPDDGQVCRDGWSAAYEAEAVADVSRRRVEPSDDRRARCA